MNLVTNATREAEVSIVASPLTTFYAEPGDPLNLIFHP